MTTHLELTLARLESWYRANDLKLNATKTQYVVFGTRQMQRHLPNIALSLGNAVIAPTGLLKNLV